MPSNFIDGLGFSFHCNTEDNKILHLQFNGPVEEYDSQQKKDVEAEEELVQGDDSCQSEDTEEDSGDETAAIVCTPDQDEAKEEHTGDDEKAEGGLDLDTIPEGEDAESDREDQDEEYSGKKDKISLENRRSLNTKLL